MSVFLRRSCGAALAYAITTQSAFADLTANDVWSDWQAYLGGMGYTVTGDQSVSGNVTTITDFIISLAVPESSDSVQMTIPEVTLTENGDGTVQIVYPESFPVTISGGGEGDSFSGDLLYTNKNLNIVVSGSPDDMAYNYSAASMGFVVNALDLEGEDIPEDSVDASLEITDVSGNARMQIGENRDIVQSITAAGLAYKLVVQDPETGHDININGRLEQLAFDGTTIIPAIFDAADIKAIYEAGFAVNGAFSYTSGSTDIEGVSEDETFSMSSSSKGGRFSGSIDAKRLAYEVSQTGSKLAMTMSELPVPVEINAANTAMVIEVPVLATEEVQPFAFSLNLNDFTMSDVLWGMFDPTGALPRDPATIAINTLGTAKILIDFMDPEVSEQIESGQLEPAELHSLKIKELLISMVGANLTGDGDFTFDNTNTQEFGGMPAPTGELNLQLVGANALIDKLIAMGFVSESDAMGARMMMGLMAVPGEEPDTLNSKIEFTENGQILANGQRIK
ncbi:DUF2125 domain-containing protein [Ruegeria arenilitoris]|uniref:DUF2125 domain-containing protein n=1 Tax=Ruegeria arenilitoris TaxID=1173585 RepID=UPI001480311F|nr:DUF2125 domain-containing protein [Ruegeria arenilitoris]